MSRRSATSWNWRGCAFWAASSRSTDTERCGEGRNSDGKQLVIRGPQGAPVGRSSCCTPLHAVDCAPQSWQQSRMLADCIAAHHDR